jgi:hypothetical protein
MRLLTGFSSFRLAQRKMRTAETSKRLIVFLALSCLLVDPMVSTFTWLHYKKAMVKKEVKRRIVEGIDRDELVLLKFSKKETKTKLRWSHPKEFEYNHKMYDIVETKTEEDTVYYWCWYDHEETMLNRHLEEVAHQALGKGPKIRKEGLLLIPQFKSLYFLFSFLNDVSIPYFLCERVDLFIGLSSQILIQPPSPPPQSA